MPRVNRNKVKVTYIDPGKGHWGMHDGWGTWDKERFHRVLGFLICKKHWRIPDQTYSDWANCYVFSCAKCAEEEAYSHRRTRVLNDRSTGRKARLDRAAKERAEGALRVACMKEIYSNYAKRALDE